MNIVKDLTNARFGKLIVLKRSEKKGSRGELYWDCICDCGNPKTASGDNLKSGKVKSCGCLRHREPPNKCNLIGQRFGRLVVLSEVPNAKGRWLCRCDCGNEVDVAASELKKRNIRSCKCLQRELARARRKMNQFGLNNASYNPSLTDEDRISRRCVKGYKEWSLEVKQKANFTCELCGDDRGGNLVSHHLYSYMKFRELRLEPSNGVCLCEDCHDLFHNNCGWGDNTKEQYFEFVGWYKDDRIYQGQYI